MYLVTWIDRDGTKQYETTDNSSQYIAFLRRLGVKSVISVWRREFTDYK
jgi:hypothetical protein